MINSVRTHLGRILSTICLGAASMMVAASASAQQAFPIAKDSVKPVDDSFYVSPSSSALSGLTPGAVIRYRPIPLGSYSSFTSEGYQLMYRSTGQQGQPTAAVTTVLIPKNAPLLDRKLLAYQSFYDSLTINCTPSYLTVKGNLFEE